jgi:hypothetical protein
VWLIDDDVGHGGMCVARPSQYVRSLEEAAEMEHLPRFRKSGRQAVRQRADIVLASMVHTPVYQIALIFRTDEAYVRKVIHASNGHGFDSLNPKSVLAGRRRLSRPSASASWPSPWHRRPRSASR